MKSSLGPALWVAFRKTPVTFQIAVGTLVAVAVAIIVWGIAGQRGELRVAVRLGIILPLSGPGGAYGRSAHDGIELALDTLQHRMAGTSVRVFYEDSLGEPKTAVSAFEKLIVAHKIHAIIGPLSSSCVLAVAPKAERVRIVLLSPTASAPTISDAGDYIFRNVASDAYEASHMAKFAYTVLGHRNVGILYVNNDFGLGHRNAFEDTFKELGGNVVGAQAFAASSTSFRAQLIALQETSPEAIYLVGGKEMGAILKQAHEMGLGLRFLSFSMFEDPDILTTAGAAAEGVYYSLQRFDPASQEEPMRWFAARFEERYGRLPDPFAALSYEAVFILAEAARISGGFSSDEIKQGLYLIQEFEGLGGRLSFDPNGDVLRDIVIKRVKNGRFTWVDEGRD